MENLTHRLSGRVVDAATGEGARGLRVLAFDADRGDDDALGRADTDADGRFEIAFGPDAFETPGPGDDPVDRMPDVYFEIYRGDELLRRTDDEVLFNVRPGTTDVTLEIGGERDIEPARARFTSLLLANPNYFGTFPDLDFEAVEPQSGNTSYEQVVCLGLHPDQDRLEAVIHIKRPFGYGSGPCGAGSIEYVRFFAKRSDSPEVWEDLGLATVRVFNLPGSPHPVAYTVSIEFDDPRRFCRFENLVDVRAILSWNLAPPPGNANWTPPWGNAIDATVQIDAFRLFSFPIGELVAQDILQIDPSFVDQIELEKPLPVKSTSALSYGKLKQMYEKADVPAHRFGFAAAQPLVKGPLQSTQLLQAASQSVDLQAGLIPSADLAEIIEGLQGTQGSTAYEQLLCAGYNPATREVGGVLTIKRSAGYSGGLCTDGSTEYVGFWVHDGSTWHALGVAQVQVYDLSGIGGGNTVEYAVLRPTNAVPEFACEDVRSLRLRAILSWNTPPTGPNFTPTWGNVVNTFIQPPEGEPLDDGVLNQLRLFHINRAPLDAINDATGRATNPIPATGECTGVDRPFGNSVIVEGDFLNKPDVFNDATGDVLPGATPLRYRVFWKPQGVPGLGTQLTNPFPIRVYPSNPPPGPISVVKTQQVTPDGTGTSYTYFESGVQAVNPRTLAVWDVTGLDNGLYTLIVQGLAWNGTQYVTTNFIVQNLYVYNGFPHLETIAAPGGGTTTVEQKRPELDLTLDAGACSDILVGDPVEGTYTVRDEFFGSLSVQMVPITIGGVTHQGPVTVTNPGTVVPHPGVTPSVQTVSGDWSLDTEDLPACGYTVELGAWDRALVGLSCNGHYNRIGVGFCLREG